MFGCAEVYNDAIVFGNAQIFEDAEILESAKIYDNVMISGDVKVFGDAQIFRDVEVSGYAEISGDAQATKKVITFIDIFCYDITITDNHIKIGCQQHLKSEWENFTDKEIIEMDGKMALKFWRLFKPFAESMGLFD